MPRISKHTIEIVQGVGNKTSARNKAHRLTPKDIERTWEVHAVPRLCNKGAAAETFGELECTTKNEVVGGHIYVYIYTHIYIYIYIYIHKYIKGTALISCPHGTTTQEHQGA